MTIEELMKLLKNEEYAWSLYFFRKDKRCKNQPFSAYKKRYKDSSRLDKYVQDLLTSIRLIQFAKVDKIEEYNGMNANIACARIEINNDLIKSAWENFSASIKIATDKSFEGKIVGYAICGEPINESDKPITFVKFSCPNIQLSNKNSIVYKENPQEELEAMTDNYYRLFWFVDMIVYDDNIYLFNNNFEAVFDIEKAVRKVRTNAIEKIINTNLIENITEFKDFAESYSSPKVFISLSQERLDRLKTLPNRKEIAETHELHLTEDGKIIILTEEDFKNFINFVCLKTVCEDGTKIIYSVNSATKQEKNNKLNSQE